MSSIRMTNVNKTYGQVPIISSFSCLFPDRQFVTLLGPSGCGKTTLLRLIAKIPLLRTLGRDQLVNYIISTARNTALNFLRDKKRITQFSFDESIDSLDAYRTSDTALERLELIEMMEVVGEAWSRLDDKYKRVLELKYILEQSNEEIAKEFDIGPNSVRMLLTRARSKLKELMADKVGMT